jgi:putative transposase
MYRRRPRQLEMQLKTWGGKRAGAGRKRKRTRAGVPHRHREAVASRYPVHVTLRLKQGYCSLRTRSRLKVVRAAFVGAVERGFRVTDWSLQRDHIHMVVEPQSREKLSASMKGLNVRIAKGLNKLLGTKGTVFDDRYHMRILKTPREVRNCLAYVLNNARHHGHALPSHQYDAYSSAEHFDGFRGVVMQARPAKGPPPVASPGTWLRNVGWRRHGLIRLDEVPSCRKA